MSHALVSPVNNMAYIQHGIPAFTHDFLYRQMHDGCVLAYDYTLNVHAVCACCMCMLYLHAVCACCTVCCTCILYLIIIEVQNLLNFVQVRQQQPELYCTGVAYALSMNCWQVWAKIAQ